MKRELIQGWGAWADRFEPIANPKSQYGEQQFETYGEDWEFIKNYDHRYVWTWYSGDGYDCLVNGVGWVNRLSYYITKHPWDEDTDYEVAISEENPCVCYPEEADEPDENCKVCEGSGFITTYPTPETKEQDENIQV